MSSKGKNPFADHEFLRSATIEKENCEDEYGVVVRTTISMLRSPCVLRIRLEAWTTRTEDPQTPLCAYEVDWPNATTMSWTAQLFNAQVKLSRLVEDARRDAWNLLMREGGRG